MVLTDLLLACGNMAGAINTAEVECRHFFR